jgi:uracil-DNA glycosylase
MVELAMGRPANSRLARRYQESTVFDSESTPSYGPSLEKLQDRVMECKRCAELVKCRSRPVPGYGDSNPDILFIGEAPGRYGADVTGVPFTRDRSGRLFLRMLGSIGLTTSSPDDDGPILHKAFVTNIVKCNPRGKNGTNRPPTKDEIDNCKEYLKDEIRILSPKIIVPLGMPACRQILGQEFDGKDLGKPIVQDNVWIFPLWHPAFVVRGGGIRHINERRYRREFNKLVKLLVKINPEFKPLSMLRLNDY